MTSFDFLSGFNNIDPKFILDAIDLMQTVEASDAEKEIMNMENYTIHKKRTVRRSVLVAAVIALLCAMCVGAYAVNLFGIRDAVMGSQIVSDHYVDGEYAGKKLADGMTISMQGCIGSPEYRPPASSTPSSAPTKQTAITEMRCTSLWATGAKPIEGSTTVFTPKHWSTSSLRSARNTSSSRGTLYTKAPDIRAFARSSAAMAF